ncbi:MAG: Bug family tripartite tricarboxylate transporter substrate binding protein [Lautropia sp.]
MNRQTIPLLRRCLAAALGLFLVASASAQTAYPARPLRILVPFAAGGGVDITARMLAEALRKTLGQGVVVENMPGAATMIATRAAVRAAPDGYTLLMADSSMAVNPLLHKDMDYSWEKDLAPISLVVKVPNVLTVHPGLPIHNAKELVEYAKANPISYASSGTGNANHLGGELINKMAGTSIAHVPYKGVAPQLADVAAGHVAMTLASIGASQAFIQSGKARPIAVSSASRSSSLPDVPALGEYAPFSGFDVSNYFGLFAPAGTPPAILGRLSQEVERWLADPEASAKLRGMGFEPAGNTPEQFREFVQGEAKRYGRIIVEANVSLEK